jgi:hypothetical protein
VDQALLSSKSRLLSLPQNQKIQVAYDPIDVTRRLFDSMSYHPSITMRLCQQVFAVAIIFLATPSVAGPSHGSRLFPPFSDRMPDDLETFKPAVIAVSNETKREEPDIDMFALMSGKCSTLNVAGRDFACRAVAYFHTQHGRANFTVALDDPADHSHIISFSGENARREQDNLYELQIDRMLLNSQDRPKVDGLPVPSAESSAGICRQVGNFATRRVSSISCTAMDKNGKKYELQFESDGAPITLRKIRQAPLTEEKRRARQIEQFECRSKADVAKILRRDLTAYIIRCLGLSQTPATDEPQ